MNNSPPQNERRVHSQVREVFVSACELLAPIVAGNDTVKMVSSFAMMQIVKENYPELSSTEIHIIISTVEKMHREEILKLIRK